MENNNMGVLSSALSILLKKVRRLSEISSPESEFRKEILNFAPHNPHKDELWKDYR